MRTLLDTHLNHGLQLPGSGDQLHIDVTLTAAPDHAEAVELSRTARPEGSDHLNWRLHSTDPAATPEEAAERRTRDDAAVLQHLLGYAGVPGRGAAEALLRELVRQSATGTPAPGPAVPQHFLRAVESVVTSAAVVDHPLTARGTRPPSGIDDPSQALRTASPAARTPGLRSRRPSPSAPRPPRPRRPERRPAPPGPPRTPTRTRRSSRSPGRSPSRRTPSGPRPPPSPSPPRAGATARVPPRERAARARAGAPTGRRRLTDEPVLLDFPGTAAVDDAVDAARREYEDAAAAFDRAARAVRALDARVSDGRGGADDTARLYDAWQELGRAQRRLDAALDRLRDLGADAAHDAAVASIVPRVSRTDAERRLTSALVTAGDLPADPPRPAPDDLITAEELAAAGVTPDQAPALEAALNGSVRFEDSGITDPVQRVRLLMNRPGPWSEALDGIAARASRRTWNAAYESFALDTFRAAGVPVSTDPAEAWRRAASLVLPLELHPVLADSRHTRADHLDAVRRVAEHLAVHGADAVSGTELAARVRRDLGLPPRLPGGAPRAFAVVRRRRTGAAGTAGGPRRHTGRRRPDPARAAPARGLRRHGRAAGPAPRHDGERDGRRMVVERRRARRLSPGERRRAGPRTPHHGGERRLPGAEPHRAARRAGGHHPGVAAPQRPVPGAAGPAVGRRYRRVRGGGRRRTRSRHAALGRGTTPGVLARVRGAGGPRPGHHRAPGGHARRPRARPRRRPGSRPAPHPGVPDGPRRRLGAQRPGRSGHRPRHRSRADRRGEPAVRRPSARRMVRQRRRRPGPRRDGRGRLRDRAGRHDPPRPRPEDADHRRRRPLHRPRHHVRPGPRHQRADARIDGGDHRVRPVRPGIGGGDRRTGRAAGERAAGLPLRAARPAAARRDGGGRRQSARPGGRGGDRAVHPPPPEHAQARPERRHRPRLLLGRRHGGGPALSVGRRGAPVRVRRPRRHLVRAGRGQRQPRGLSWRWTASTC